MSRLPYGFWTPIVAKSGISVTKLSDYANARIRPGRKRALELQELTGVKAMIWLYGTADVINQALRQARDRAEA